MPRDPRLAADQAEPLLLENGFALVHSKGSHRIYGKGGVRVVVPYHTGQILHPNIVRQIHESIADSVP